MRFFDCNCSFGKGPLPAFKYARDAAELADEMDFCGIDRALVYAAGMRFGSPTTWNSLVVAEAKRYPALEPTWAILPPQTGEMPYGPELLDTMKANGVRALRAFPDEHRYRLDRRTFADVFDALIEKRIPLFVKQNLVAIGDLLAEVPDLVVVAVNQGPHSLERYLRPLIESYPNLYVDTSYYIVDGLIEEFCERYGPERLLFGSAYPDNCSGAALLRLIQADIDAQGKSAIAGGNLERLLGEVRL